MPLHAKKFFAELNLPFATSTVIGNRYYAALAEGSPLRLRIDFAPTIRHGEYDGLRLTVLHHTRGALYTETLSFADHDTFSRRDAEQRKPPGHDGYARIRDWHPAGPAPWRGADLTGLRQAVTAFTALWTHAPDVPSTVHRRAQGPSAQHDQGPGLRHPDGFWAGDRDFLALLDQATLLIFDFAESGTLDGAPVSQNLRYARYGVRDLLGLPIEYGFLAEVEAVAHITQTTGRPYGAGTAEALARIDALSPQDQHTLVKDAARRYTAAAAAPQPRALPGPPTALPAAAPPRPAPAR